MHLLLGTVSSRRETEDLFTEYLLNEIKADSTIKLN